LATDSFIWPFLFDGFSSTAATVFAAAFDFMRRSTPASAARIGSARYVLSLLTLNFFVLLFFLLLRVIVL
jgi:hypothetical protein